MSDELKILRQQNEHLRDALERLEEDDRDAHHEGYQEGLSDGYQEAEREGRHSGERAVELEDLIADFFLGVADEQDLRRAVSA